MSNRGHLCGTVRGRPDGSDIDDVTTITCDVTATYVTIYQGTDNGGSTALDFIELEVYGKQTSTYLIIEIAFVLAFVSAMHHQVY